MNYELGNRSGALLLLLPLLLLTSCFYQHPNQQAWQKSADSITSNPRHYDVGYNFVVLTDSLLLCTEIPSRAQQLAVMPDSQTIYVGDDIVVAQIDTIPEDEQDSIWLKVARDQMTQGWIHESQLLQAVSPDDPISIAINAFSAGHLWGTLILVCLLLTYILLKHIYDRLRHKNKAHDNQPRGLLSQLLGRSVLLHGPLSPYPVLLCLLLSGSAVLYASIQIFAPQTWAEYYFSPTINPFAVTPLLGAFLISIWGMLLFFIATLDDVFSQLSLGRALRYIFSLITLLGVLYLFFSLTTLIYVGYPLYVVYTIASLIAYWRHFRPRYRCGHCHQPLHSKGLCPHCGTRNE